MNLHHITYRKMLFCEMIIFWRNTRFIQRLSSFLIPNDQLPAVCCVILLFKKINSKQQKRECVFWKCDTSRFFRNVPTHLNQSYAPLD